MRTNQGRALIVDDESSVRSFCRIALEQMGFDVDVSDNGGEALRLLDGGLPYDLLLLDLHLPDVDGVDVLRYTKRADDDLATVVITGQASLENTARATLLGAQAILLKPFSVDELRSTVDQVLRKRQADRSAAQMAALHPLIQISERLLGQLDLPRLYEQIVATALDTLHADRALLLLADTVDMPLRLAAQASTSNGERTRRSMHTEIAAWVARHHAPALLTAEPQQQPELELLRERHQPRSTLCVPLIAREHVLGVVYVDKLYHANAFTLAHQDLLLLLASLVAIALENAQLYHLAQRRADRLARLNALSSALASTLDLGQVLRIAAQHLHEALPNTRGVVLLLDDDSRTPCQAQFFGIQNHPSLPAVCAQLGVAGSVLADGQPRYSRADDAGLAPWERLLLAVDPGLLCVPLASDSGLRGAIELSSAAEAVSQEDAQFVDAIATQVALAIEKARLHTNVAQSEARYRALLEHARDAVLLLDRNGTTILEANPAVMAWSGYTREQIADLDPAMLIRAADGAGLRFDAPLVGGMAEFEASMTASDGGLVPVSVGLSEVTHDGMHYLLLIARDIGERQRMAQRLIQAEKLAGMGRMTASIAHEVNNPLQALQSSLNLVTSRPMAEEKREQILHMARGQTEQLVAVVQHMMDLYRPSRDGMRPVLLGEVLESALTFVGPRLQTHSIVIRREWESPLPRIRAVSSHLKQVFISLLMNAVDAMPEGGVLTVRALRQHSAAGEQVCIEVADTGKGIAPAELPSIFEPFYSTRTDRSGMGLAVSYSIVEQHEGSLSVQSSEVGATFRVTLPAL